MFKYYIYIISIMGKARYIYFDDEINEMLGKENNKSALINRLLKEHYEKTELKMMSREQLAIELKKAQIREEMEIKIKEVENGQANNNRNSKKN